MKKNPVSLVEFALIGIGIGIPVTLTCMTLIGGFNAVIAEFLVWTAASALYGLLSGAFICSERDLSLPMTMTLHCACCLTVTVGACKLCGYADSLKELLVGILPVFVVVYALVYTFCILMMKLNEKQINQALNKE